MQEEQREPIYPARKWVKRTGIVAFIFFLGKGLIWLGALVLGAYYYTIN